MKDFKIREPLYGETGWAVKNDKNEIILDNDFKLYKCGTKLVLNNDNYTINFKKTHILNNNLTQKELNKLCSVNIENLRFSCWDLFLPLKNESEAGSVVATLNFRDSAKKWYIFDKANGLIWIGPEKQFLHIRDVKEYTLNFIKENATAYISDNGDIRLKWN